MVIEFPAGQVSGLLIDFLTSLDRQEDKERREKLSGLVVRANLELETFIFDLKGTETDNHYFPNSDKHKKGFLNVLPDHAKVIVMLSLKFQGFNQELYELFHGISNESVNLERFWWHGQGEKLTSGKLLTDYITKLELINSEFLAVKKQISSKGWERQEATAPLN